MSSPRVAAEGEETTDQSYGLPHDREALDALFSATYEELRRLAASVKRSDALATISPTTLVDEAWLKLSASPPGAVFSRLHFRRIAARAMRQVLVEAARRRGAERRGGGTLIVTFDDGVQRTDTRADQLIALDEALDVLASMNPRQAEMIEMRFFSGLDIPETARLLGVSEATVQRDWRAARAWLARQLRAT